MSRSPEVQSCLPFITVFLDIVKTLEAYIKNVRFNEINA